MPVGFCPHEDRQPKRCVYLPIGDITVALQSELRGLLDEVPTLFAPAPATVAPSKTIHIEVRKARLRATGRRYRVYADGKVIGGEHRSKEVFPFIEWGINLRVMATRSQYVQLHAASMAHRGTGFIFAGDSGSGKSTLAAGLMPRGWNYLCDEFALIDRNTLRLHPFPKPLCIKAGSFPVIKRLGLPIARRRDYIKSQKGRVGYINPHDVKGHSIGRLAPIRFVIFPKYAENQQPRLYRVSRARALMDLAGCVFNRHVFEDQALSILHQVVSGAECFRLAAGDIEETCDVVESLLDGATKTRLQEHGKPSRRATARYEAQRKRAPGRRDLLKLGAKAAYVAPVILTLSAQEAFAGSKPSGVCSTALNAGALCETDADCCSNDCDFGVCQ